MDSPFFARSYTARNTGSGGGGGGNGMKKRAWDSLSPSPSPKSSLLFPESPAGRTRAWTYGSCGSSSAASVDLSSPNKSLATRKRYRRSPSCLDPLFSQLKPAVRCVLSNGPQSLEPLESAGQYEPAPTPRYVQWPPCDAHGSHASPRARREYFLRQLASPVADSSPRHPAPPAAIFATNPTTGSGRADARESSEARANPGAPLTDLTLAGSRIPRGAMMTRPATTIAQLMLIRACHSEALRRHSLGTALGLRTRRGRLTDVPAIVVFVSRKVHEEWLLPAQKLPRKLQGPGGYECDVDVVELTNQRSGCRSSSSPGAAGHVAGDAGDVAGTVGVAAEAAIIDNPLVEQLRGSGSKIGPGSQIASEEVYGTLGAIVKKASRSNSSGSGSGGGGGGGGGGHGRTSGTGGMSSSLGGSSGCLGVGFLASRHVAVDLDQLKQKLFHPLPVSLGPGRFLGSVERALPFASDHAWFGVFANMNPDSFVRTDGAYIPFHEEFDLSVVTTQVAGIGPVGPPRRVNLSDDIRSVVGQHVWKVGSASGLTQGTIAAYAVEHSEGGGTSLFTDLLIVGRHGHAFDTQGDSGALVLMLPTAAHSPAVLASLQLSPLPPSAPPPPPAAPPPPPAAPPPPPASPPPPPAAPPPPPSAPPPPPAAPPPPPVAPPPPPAAPPAAPIPSTQPPIPTAQAAALSAEAGAAIAAAVTVAAPSTLPVAAPAAAAPPPLPLPTAPPSAAAVTVAAPSTLPVAAPAAAAAPPLPLPTVPPSSSSAAAAAFLTPVAMVLGGGGSRGGMRLGSGRGAQQCSSAVELARLLSLLDLEMVTTDGELREFAPRQRLLRTPGNSSPTPGHGARGSADEIGRGERGRGEEIAELEKKEEEEGKEGAEESVGKRQRVEG